MIKAINNFVTVKPLQQIRKGLIQMLETAQKSFVGIVTSVGKDVRNKTIIKDRIVFCNDAGRISVLGTHFFKEQDILMALQANKVWRPLGRKILLKRQNEEFKIGNIIIPDCRKSTDQTLHCIYISPGIIDNNLIDDGFDLVAGDEVRLVSWDKEIREVEIDGGFFIIVKPSHILYRIEGDDSSNRLIN